MSFTPDPDFEWFLEKFGQPEHSKQVSFKTIEKFRGKLPERLLEYWQEYGFCIFKEGRLRLVNPEEYEGVVSTWLNGTEIVDLDRFHAIAMSGFGEIYLWGETTGQSVNIEIFNGRIFLNGSDEKNIKARGADDRIRAFFGIIGTDTVDLEDLDTNESIFDQAVMKLGRLDDDQIFGFEPALFLGGEQNANSVTKVNFFIHNEILASMGQREILDIDGLAKKAFG